MKKAYAFCLATCLAVLLCAFSLHLTMKKELRHLKVGFIFVGDEATPYTDNFIKARDHVQEVYGDQIECLTAYNVSEGEIDAPLQNLITKGCDYIIAASYGYGPAVKAMAEQHPEVEFCVPTGDNANTAPVLTNYHNCYGDIYQGRYVCGQIAGLKLQEMLSEGIIHTAQAKVGYVAAFPYAEVISGYTAFYLGVQSVVPEATMLVKYTNTWSSYSREKQCAKELIDEDCVVISQHSDTVGPATICEKTTRSIPVYHVGYNQSMTSIAPTRSLVSCAVDYSYYFEQSIGALLHGKRIEDCIDGRTYGQDATAGLEKGWVRILDINEAIVPEDTDAKVAETVDQLKKGTLSVFSGPFTGTSVFDPTDHIDLRTPYIENEHSSAPTFHYVLDDVISVEEMEG